MEFKGTKGKWHSKVTASGMNKGALAMRVFSENQNTLTDNGVCRLNVDEYSKNIQEEQIEMKANALLISKAPEMLEMLKSNLLILNNTLSYIENIERYVPMCDRSKFNTNVKLIDNKVKEAEQLIKQATEL